MGPELLSTHSLLRLPAVVSRPPHYRRGPSFSTTSSSLPFSRLALSLPDPLSRRWMPICRRNGKLEVAGAQKEEVEGGGAVDGAEAEGDDGVSSEDDVEAKPPRKPIVKLGDIMGILNKRAIEASESKRPVPDIRTGDIVEIKLEVPENRRRVSIYKGIVMSRQNAGIHTTIRIRRIIAGIGVEIVFPLYSPNIKEVKVVAHRKVRRARLYYLRDKLPRLSTFK